MRSLSKKAGVRPPLQERLLDKIDAIRELQHQEASKTSYLALQFILNNKKVSEGVLLVFLKQMYGQRYETISHQWVQELKNEKILEDLYTIKRKAIQQQWIAENMNKKNIHEQEQRFREYLVKTKNKHQLRERLKVLSEEMRILENNINMAKKEEEVVALKEKYNTIKQEHVFLSNRNRRINTFTIQRQAVDHPALINHQKIAQLSDLAEEKSQEKQRKRYLETLKKQNRNHQSTKQLQQSKSTAQSRMKKLEDIFDSFAKKESKEDMLFGQIHQAHKGISLESFLKMIAYSRIDLLLTVEQRVAIFKKWGKYSKKMEFIEFTAALNELFRENCEKLKIKFDAQMVDVFVDEFIQKISAFKPLPNYPEVAGNERKNASIQSNELSRYRFKLSIHSGKLEGNIKEQLAQRKKVKKDREKLIKEKSATVDHRQGQVNRSKSIQTEDSYLFKQPILGFKRRHLYDLPEILNQKEQNQTIVPRRSSKQSYATIFENRKMIAFKQQRYSTENSMVHREEEKSSLVANKVYTENEFISSFNNKVTPSYSPVKSFDYELRELISDEEDDPFLTNHLQKKNILPANDISSRKYKKIHF